MGSAVGMLRVLQLSEYLNYIINCNVAETAKIILVIYSVDKQIKK